MKKVIVLAMAFLLAGFVTGCGGGGGGGGSAATTKAPDSSQNTNNGASGATGVSQAGGPALTSTQVKLSDADKALNITYKSVANGDFPPAPPVSSAPDASAAIN